MYMYLTFVHLNQELFQDLFRHRQLNKKLFKIFLSSLYTTFTCTLLHILKRVQCIRYMSLCDLDLLTIKSKIIKICTGT